LPPDDVALDLLALGRSDRHGVPRERLVDVLRVGEHAKEDGVLVQMVVHHDSNAPLVALERRDAVERQTLLLERLDVLGDDRRRPLELVEPGVDQPVLERRHDGDVDDRERPGDEAGERERQLDADGAEPVHVSRKR
jgi:hypothetical protein